MEAAKVNPFSTHKRIEPEFTKESLGKCGIEFLTCSWSKRWVQDPALAILIPRLALDKEAFLEFPSLTGVI